MQIHLDPGRWVSVPRAFVTRVASISLTFGLALAYAGAWYDLVVNGRVQGGFGSTVAAIQESVGYMLGGVPP